VKEIEVYPPPPPPRGGNFPNSSVSYLVGWRSGWQAGGEALPGRVQRASLGPCKYGPEISKTQSFHLQCIAGIAAGEDVSMEWMCGLLLGLEILNPSLDDV
jgi:hypothetical protein